MFESGVIPKRSLDVHASLEEWREAFSGVPRYEFIQGWNETLDVDFRPGKVGLAWSEVGILVFAELEDQCFVNQASSLNEWTWELGDVFEVFIKRQATDPYFEFHVTPDNHRLQLQFSKPGAVDEDGFDLKTALLEGDVIQSRVWPEPHREFWSIGVLLPFELLGAPGILGEEYQFSCSRYDYTQGKKRPVLSSTSPHRIMRFHRVHEWRVGRLGE